MKNLNESETLNFLLLCVRCFVIVNKLVCHAHFKLSANQITWSRMLIKMHILNGKQCRSRSVGFFRSQLIWIYTVLQKQDISGFSRTRVQTHTNIWTILIYIQRYTGWYVEWCNVRDVNKWLHSTSTCHGAALTLDLYNICSNDDINCTMSTHLGIFTISTLFTKSSST